MYQLMITHIDKKQFGCKTIVYQDKNTYFLIVNDRDDIGYYIVDKELSKCYPINTVIKNNQTMMNFDSPPASIDFMLDVSKYGYSPCPQWIKVLIEERTKNGSRDTP